MIFVLLSFIANIILLYIIMFAAASLLTPYLYIGGSVIDAATDAAKWTAIFVAVAAIAACVQYIGGMLGL